VGKVISFVLLGTLVLGLFAFVWIYGTGSDWRESRVGRYLFYFMLTITGTFAYILISPLTRDIPGRIYVDLLILVLLNYGAWKLTWLLRKIQKGDYDDEKFENTDKENIR
jgi:hypothetical protein